MNNMFSIIILTRNRCVALQRLFAALAKQTVDEYEIIVVDTGSTDTTLEWLSRLNKANLRVIQFSPEEGGFAEARNRGVQEASGEYIAFIDDDCEPPEQWLEWLQERLTTYDAVGGATLPPPELIVPCWWSGGLNWLVGLMPSPVDPESTGAIYPQAANLAIRKDIALKEPFQELGEVFGSKKREIDVYKAGREDARLWWRLRVNGYRVLFDPDIAVYHHIPPDRFNPGYLIKRAFRDGYVMFLRRKQYGYLSVATYQLFDIVTRIAQQSPRDRSVISGIIEELFWTVRQMGFVAGYADYTGDYAAVAVTSIKGCARYLFSMGKAIGRKIFAAGYRLLKRRKVISHTGADNILLICNGYVGDFLIIQPAISTIRRILPDSELTLLCNEPGCQLYNSESEPRIPLDTIVPLPEEKKEQAVAIDSLIEAYNFKAAVLFYYHNAACIPLFFYRKAPPLISFSDDVGFSKRLWYDLLDYAVEKDYSRNEIYNHLKLVECLTKQAIEEEPPRIQLDIDVSAVNKADSLLEVFNNKVIVGINTGTALPEKRWEIESWTKLVDELCDEYDIVRCVFLGDHREKEYVGHIRRNLQQPGKTLDCTGATDTLMELAAVIKRFALLITTDSGAKHIAFALGVPTVAFYGVNDEQRWGALWDTDRHIALRAAPLSLTADELIGFPPNHMIRLITVDDALSAARRLLTSQKIK